MGMTLAEARVHVVSAVHYVSAAKDDMRFAGALDDPAQDVQFEDFKFDSLAEVEVCMALKEATNVEIELADLVAYPSVNRLAELLLRRSTGK